MSLFEKLTGQERVDRDLLLLLFIGGFYSLAVSLSNTFVNIYLWKQTGDFRDLALYNLAVVIMQPLTFIFAGRLAKQIDRILILRLGVSCLAVFFVTVLLVGSRAHQYLLFLGALLGIGYGFYWLAFNVLTFEITEPETRDFFNSFFGVLTSSAGMIGPIAAGYMISSLAGLKGYTLVFSMSLGLFIIAVLLSFFLKRRTAAGKYLFVHILKERNKNRNWRLITNAHFFQGLREGSFVFVISVLVYVTSNSEWALGKYGLVNSFTSFVAYYAVSRLMKREYRMKAILLGGLLLYAAIFLIVFQPSYPRLIIYAATIAIAYPLLLVPYSSLTFDVIGKSWKSAEARVEYIVVRELFLNVGRVASILAFLAAMALFGEKIGIRVLMFVCGAGHLVIYWFVRRIRFTDGHPERDRQEPLLLRTKLAGERGGPSG
ncbi:MULTISPECIES: MFS transporter [Geobacillus]|uniref:Transporter, MFS superfamily n=1 Tax=Geobacillus thermodenitrificans (strain NG80-2) TaxID=420246 RepID=A4IQZ0_GEOTN|nr:MFS transporter [Geobacillus thermodenitrificans]ABO67744.1 Transporter, MFS superfamily [Geobacillus thermodenitrificans NG80-2]MEC5187375.1 YQGE family putative transporter [Geobacillus thermodenitrificans]MED0662546.1 MFS transporter [Geobacillus thermodenitrificans]